ncbi:NAD(P)H-binding protein, partial [Kitasatospora sp. NPDC059747]|uniref:NAD(P)H-binding protein n=1 Tax=Kitasatospora sp. NPDC059747 TaxID=3346930 RepID=UPI00364CDD76
MKLTVLGATGGIGRHLVRLALADGHRVTAAVRDPARLPLQHERLTVVTADAPPPPPRGAGGGGGPPRGGGGGARPRHRPPQTP